MTCISPPCCRDFSAASSLTALSAPDATFVATNVELGSFGGRATVHRNHRGTLVQLGELKLVVPGRHNLQNALAAIAVADELGVRVHDCRRSTRRLSGCGEAIRAARGSGRHHRD